MTLEFRCFATAKYTLLIMIIIFLLPGLKRRFTLLQSKINNRGGGNPGFFCNLIACGNSIQCMAVETYCASSGDTQTVITKDIREHRNIGIPF